MFQLNGNANGRTTTKNDWPLEVVAHLISLTQKGTSAKDAFTQAVEEYNATGPKEPLTLPPSVEKYAASILWGMKTRFVKKCNNEKAKDRLEALALAEKYGLGSNA